MTTKTITVMEDAYKLLLLNKKMEESFSEELRRILPKKKSIMEFAGAWKDMSEKETEEMKNNIKKLRKNATKELIMEYGK